MDIYTILHCHTMLSNATTTIDSVTGFQDYVDKAKECGMSALAISEHGNILEWWHKKCAIEKAGMKYIHAVEAYVTYSLKEKIRDNYHCLLIAKNYEGFLELNKLISNSFNKHDNHFYYSPRITYDELKNTSDNIIVSTGCLGGILNKADENLYLDFIDWLIQNKSRCFLEIQHHNVDEQIAYNKKLINLSKRFNIPLLATTDTHCLNNIHVKGREILQLAKNIKFEEESGWDLTFKTYDELCAAFEKQGISESVYKVALENTNKIADMVEPFDLDKNTKYPKIYDNPEQTFKDKINQGIREHREVLSQYPKQKVKDIVNEEFEVYKKVGAIDFMLLEVYLREWEKQNGIQCGFGRGSVSGSMIAYLLDVTQMNSLKFNLNFFRFLSPNRVSNADIDTDYSNKDREKIKSFLLKDHMNLDNIQCSEIITFNTIATKGAVKDVARALNIPLNIAQEISNQIVDNKIPDELRKKYEKLFEYVDIVNGVVVSVGSHPSGVLVTDKDIASNIGVCSLSTSDYPVSMLNMKELDDLMWVKLDLLGLDNVGVINETCKLIGIDRLNPDSVNLNDENVWRSIRNDTTLIFQWESESSSNYLKKFMSDETIRKAKKYIPDFSYIKWFSFGNGLIRPACASYRDEVANGKIVKTGLKELDEFLAPTLGRVTMQEDIMQFLVKFCGYSQADSDNVRRCIDENSWIMMADGSRKKIKYITVGEQVMSTRNDGSMCNNKVVGVYNNGIQHTITIKTKHNHELNITPSHKVLTQRGWVSGKDLSISDCIMTPKKYNGINDNLTPNLRYTCDEMFLLGMLIGDGAISEKSKLHFTNSDERLIEKFKECVNSKLRSRNCEFSTYKADGVTVDGVYSIRIKSKNYLDSVWSLIVKNKLNCLSADKHINENLLKYPVGGKMLSLLGGLFSTDGGYVSDAGCIEYYTISKRLAYDVQYLLGKCGIYSYVYKNIVKGYNYYCYKVRISQYSALKKFGDIVLPYVDGAKKNIFQKIVKENNENETKYDYLMPNEAIKEIRAMSSNFKKSLNSIKIGGLLNSGITDRKAKKIIEHIYCPQTYALIMSDYVPLKITDIIDNGETRVYDIEVEENHNYVANGLIVHNCIAKKKGTEQLLPEIEQRFIEYTHNTFNTPKEKAEQIIKPFIQTILDASSYAFSWNHSDAYSCIGYISGYLRYYYPLEFLTSALNIFFDNEEKTQNITNYAHQIGVEIKSPKFAHSKSEYMCDKEQKVIYKGVNSIKNIQSVAADILYQISQKNPDDFLELLYMTEQIKVNGKKINKTSMEILIKLGFFDKFGDVNYLLEYYSIFQKYFGKTQVKKQDFGYSLSNNIIKKETEKTIFIYDSCMMIDEIMQQINIKDCTLYQKSYYQLKSLGYTDIHIDNAGRDVYMVMGIEKNKYGTPFAQLYKPKNGKSQLIKLDKKWYSKYPIKGGEVLRCEFEHKNKSRKDEKGNWYKTDEKEWILKRYSILTKLEE